VRSSTLHSWWHEGIPLAVERYLRDAKSYQIVEGFSNIQKIIIAQDALGYRKANR
jgi:glutaryl-CoA dehydrogenase (non-decarboxylating)